MNPNECELSRAVVQPMNCVHALSRSMFTLIGMTARAVKVTSFGGAQPKLSFGEI
jgi:hypothetical protein